MDILNKLSVGMCILMGGLTGLIIGGTIAILWAFIG